MRQTKRFPVKISVVMPTYNVSVPFLKEAVESILNQSFREFEFIIIDDGSTDGSWEYLNSLDDKRLKLIHNETNLGITKSLNIGLKVAKGKYIARMDSDDRSLPLRLERQYEYMEKHPDVILCGTRVEYIGNRQGFSSGKWRRKTENMEDYRIRLLFENPGPRHPTLFIRHEQLLIHHIMYDEELRYAQDYKLFTIVSRYGKVVILDDVLVQVRSHDKQISYAHKELQFQCDKKIKQKLLEELLGNVSREEIDFHFYYSSGYYPDAIITSEIALWYKRLICKNNQRRLYNRRKLRRHIERAERKLIAHTFTEDMTIMDKLILSIRYVSFSSVFKMIVEKAAGCYD